MGLTDLPSRDEINIKRLLARCEEMSKQKRDNQEVDWRLEKYLDSVKDMIDELNSKSYKPSLEVMNSFEKRLNFLQSFIGVQRVENPLEKAKAFQAAPKPTLSSESRDVEHTVTESVHSQLREELLGTHQSSLRKRAPETSSRDDGGDLDEILKHHHLMQEKIADNMLVLARNMKEQSMIAGNIIRNDSTKVEKSALLADKNIDHLKVQSDKLQETTRKTSHCWVWILVIIVFAVFINMVLLMKVTKKKIV